MEVMNIDTVEMIATSFGFNEEGGNEGSLSNDRRGSWGNLWDKGDE